MALSAEEPIILKKTQADCFANLNYFEEDFLEILFSNCLYACYNGWDECPSINSPPGLACRYLISFIKVKSADDFNQCIFDVQAQEMKETTKLYKQAENPE